MNAFASAGTDEVENVTAFIKLLKYFIRCEWVRDEVDELDNRHSLVRWLWTVKTPLKMLATDAKKSKTVCKRDWHNMRSYLFLNMWNILDENFRLIVQWP